MPEYVNVAWSPIFHKFRDDISVVSEQPNFQWLFRIAEISFFHHKEKYSKFWKNSWAEKRNLYTRCLWSPLCRKILLVFPTVIEINKIQSTSSVIFRMPKNRFNLFIIASGKVPNFGWYNKPELLHESDINYMLL